MCLCAVIFDYLFPSVELIHDKSDEKNYLLMERIITCIPPNPRRVGYIDPGRVLLLQEFSDEQNMMTDRQYRVKVQLSCRKTTY